MDQHQSRPVPFATNLVDVYPEEYLEKIRPRWAHLLHSFQQRYDHRPDLVARSPGRVNLIGEHIDYSLYDVMPMAVHVDSLVAVRALPSSIEDTAVLHIYNVHDQRFPGQEIRAEGEITIDASKHLWTNYFLAGLSGSIKLLRERIPGFRPASLQVLVDGNVPAGGGLSSSAAFVCASSLAVMKAHKYDVSQEDLFELAIVSERLVGVNSGGMDQAASIFARASTVLDTSFYPKIGIEHVQFPITEPQMVFLVAQSFVAADKHVTAPKCYNLRVVECTLAAAVLAAKHDLQLEQDSSPLRFSLRSFHESLQAKRAGQSNQPFDAQLRAMIEATKAHLTQEEGYTRKDIASILGLSIKELERQYMTSYPIQAEKFKLRQRALHVFSEALRVQSFKRVLLSDSICQEKAEQLGNLMNQTQDSCRDVYECSCPELDELCQIARGAGAVGSRLTGAGWGGCTVHLVLSDKVDDVIAAWKAAYYGKRFPTLSAEKLEEVILTSRPSTGAHIICPSAH